ncbi:AAA family ATPase [Rhodoferax sp.]|uniref:AAA family ATPase n=1 Tax=Rhodoferax sp. TaxID=50421 RepID=UPI002730A9BB|nr:AAA family ATPase [Rhodoferax sp.]MDP2440601.1 AAA family ATPase [Rhodoferax sp.]MDZ4208972.1 AAA family ATPase [Rhodoferax sp.]
MLLEEITIENFCSCSHVNVPLSAFSPVIGYNNAGKSNILRAIVWLLRKSSLSSSKFNDINSRVVVSGVIFDPDISMLPPNQQTQIGRFVSNSRLTFRRIQETPNARAVDIKLEVLDPATGNWAANPTGIDNAIAVLFPEPIFIEAMDDASADVSQFAAKNTIGLLLKNTMEQIRLQNAPALAALTDALVIPPINQRRQK